MIRLTARQISAAMALVGMTQDDLASAADMARPSLNRILNEEAVAKDDTLRKIRLALEAQGVEFIGNVGVQWAQHQVKTLSGIDGLKAFFDDVRSVAKVSDEEICICGFSEDYFEKKLGNFIDYQRSEMASYEKVQMRCLVEEGDTSLGASSYCEYRWQEKENFSNVPFYIYGDRTAIIATSAPEDPLILLIRNPAISEAYRRQFGAMWNAAKEPKVKAKKNK
ncbi:MAG: helix-turn-helix transcriptional regulator [Alphaproteobacteria bacterium]